MSMRESSPRRRSPVVKGANGNGNGNGHGKTKSATSGAGATAAAARRRDEAVLAEQPRIAELLQAAAPTARRRGAGGDVTSGSIGADGGLSRTQLLEVLIAFKKGDFTVRLPVDLS